MQKTQVGFNLKNPQGNKFSKLNGSVYNRVFPKSNATSYNTYSHDHMQFRIHRLFYLNLLHTNTPVCDFEIPLKGLDHQQQLILLQQIISTSTCNIILISSRYLLSQKVTEPLRSYRSNSQVLENMYQGFAFIPSSVELKP